MREDTAAVELPPASYRDWYVITWQDAHGEQHETIRVGRAAGEYIAALLETPGCTLVTVAPAGRGAAAFTVADLRRFEDALTEQAADMIRKARSRTNAGERFAELREDLRAEARAARSLAGRVAVHREAAEHAEASSERA